MKDTKKTCVFVSEPSIKGYYEKTYALSDGIRNLQNNLLNEYAQGKTEQDVTQDLVNLFLNVGK